MMSLLPLALRRAEAQDGAMIPPQMLMDMAAAHAEQLRQMVTPSRTRPARPERSTGRRGSHHGVRAAIGHLLVRAGTSLVGQASAETVCAS